MKNKIVFLPFALAVMVSSSIAMPAFAKSDDSNKLGQAKDRLELKKEEVKKKAERLSCVKEAETKLARSLKENVSAQNTAFKTARETRNTTLKTASTALRTSTRSAEATRKSAVTTARALKDSTAKEAALKAANEAYRASIKTANSAYKTALKAAQDTYIAAVKAANGGLAPANKEDREHHKSEVEHCKTL